MVLENIRLSQREKEQLIQLKRRTKIQNWNVLCRWAFVTSLGEDSVPPSARLAADSSIEMSWRVFGGEYGDLYAALIQDRCHRDGLGTDRETLAKYFRLHLHRGLGYLFADRSIQRIRHLVESALTGNSTNAPSKVSSDEDSPRQDRAASQ